MSCSQEVKATGFDSVTVGSNPTSSAIKRENHMSKYHSKKVTYDGITFDSKKEAARYKQLKLLENIGYISELKLQPVYVLQEGFKKNGKTYRKITYRADFEYIRDGKTFVEDVKGMKTEVYKLKKKLFEYKYPDLGILEV